MYCAFTKPDLSDLLNCGINLCAINYDNILKYLEIGWNEVHHVTSLSFLCINDITAVLADSGRISFAKKSVSMSLETGLI